MPSEFLSEDVRLLTNVQIEAILISWLVAQDNPQQAFDAILIFADNNIAIKPDILWSCKRLVKYFGFKMDN
jgi:hypothetical protein